MSRFDKIQVFTEVTKASSFAQAARAFGVSTAAVSKQISTLEQELGVQLLERSTRKVSLTEAGSLYYAECVQILEKMHVADAMVRGQNLEAVGGLRVVAKQHFAQSKILPKMANFLQAYPKIQLHLELTERIPTMDENVDLLVGMSLPGPPDFIQRKIGETRYVLCASPAYLNQYGMPISVMDLRNHRYISHAMRAMTDSEYYLQSVITLNDTQGMLECAKQGIGLVKLHEYVVREAISKGQLIEVLKSLHQDKVPLFACFRPRKFLEPKVAKFLEFFTD